MGGGCAASIVRSGVGALCFRSLIGEKCDVTKTKINFCESFNVQVLVLQKVHPRPNTQHVRLFVFERVLAPLVNWTHFLADRFALSQALISLIMTFSTVRPGSAFLATASKSFPNVISSTSKRWYFSV